MKKLIISLMVLLSIISVSCFSFADVGDFESYDSDWDSDWDSSSWDSDWSSSSWDSDYSYGSSYSDDSLDGFGAFIFVVIVVVIVLASNSKNGKVNGTATGNTPQVNRPIVNYNRAAYARNTARSENVANEIRKVDKYFNDEQFLASAKNLFVKLQMAWSARDWETIRPLESENLFEQHSRQLQGYIERKQINKIERIAVNFAELVTFAQDNEKDILVVALNSSMNDYIIDEETGNILKGSKDYRVTNTYKLTFIRKKGIVTEEGTDKLKTTNCPNCGAPTTITSSGKCEFCGAVITIGAHDWVLGDMERY